MASLFFLAATGSDTVGVIHTPFQALDQVPIQASRSSSQGKEEVFREFVEGLDRSAGGPLWVRPFLDDQLRGVFATRHPARPNPMGLSVVELCGRRENLLDVAGMPDFDQRVRVKTGWNQRWPRT